MVTVDIDLEMFSTLRTVLGETREVSVSYATKRDNKR